MRVASGPYDGLVNLFTTFVTIRQPLPEPLLKQYLFAFKREFKIDSSNLKSLNFWYCYFYVIRNGSNLHRMALAWHYQYEFARNVASAFYLAGVYTGMILVFNYWWVVVEPNGSLAYAPEWIDGLVLTYPPALFMLAFIMTSRYYYLYLSYFNRFVFRSFIYLFAEKVARGEATWSPDCDKCGASPKPSGVAACDCRAIEPLST
jgi:hypothetical protein